MATVTDDTSVSIEKTREIVPDLFERNDTLWSLMKARMDVRPVGIRAMRLPFKAYPSGKARHVDFDGGDLGRGASAKYLNATVAPIDFSVAVETTKKQEYATDTKEKALFMVTKRDLSDAMWTMRTMIDCLLQTNGTGVVATIASTGSQQLTLSAPFKAYLLLENQDYDVWNAALSTNRGSVTLTSIDIENAIVTTAAALPGSTTGTDVLVVSGAAGTPPVSFYGIPYAHSNATSGLYLGVDRATVPAVRTPAVNAGGSSLSPAHVRLAINKSRMRLGVDSNKGEFIAWMHLAQSAAYEDIAQSQILIDKEASANQGFDPFFAVTTINGVKIKEGLHADPSRIDFLRLADWGRAEMKEIDYVKFGNSGGDANYVNPIYGTSGGVKAAQIWYLGVSMQFFNQNPRAGAYIYSLFVPTGY